MGRRGGPHTGPDGLVVVDKPAGWTSHDVVAKSRGLLGTRKVGHAGTLDPDATGVLLLGVGRATKLLRFLSPLGKAYVGEVQLGTETSTLDAAGEVTATFDMAGTTLDQVRAASLAFVGPIEQIPPMVSAVKIDGKRLHELARQGIEVERPPRPVTVHSLEVLPGPEGDDLVFTLAVSCSSGTYIRTLAADIGTALGGGAHLRTLRRTSVGPFTLADAVPLEQVDAERVLPMTDAVRHLDQVAVDEVRAADVAVGKVLALDELGVDGDGPWAVLGPSGSLLAVYEPFRTGTAKPSLVIPA
ncbi:tRNA pseudouridine(55) synthase TruB [Aquihabitans sp. G128]|uniref:tRNA pseudouridine(55) synthase TruB n=1 Tax=Aquihabitans sp. G128 TaxID=2849779 RepID=UPI001C218A15|nr:tRNA pseudouridine(55) synthase TruB [Aquihabitans sp. G128]QXC62585.1 tRNA pseudouridine(55) synthase TruB [Aquihabitans sp. G128]